ncbi:aryl hydrocarbon receptor isoform X3 [Salmo trutta]|uniref:aryl hydrocarbon receptor isoform X2 n=1 Tax=Salmo trutta TaxID=8032 RepID=UPI001131FBB1|nr:aryl hydrocarbon receptor-like isoform X2 [Salmo trutta]XP_029558060.1 aryl hydrocarbon receptor-like isoform X3 [Salmo trutta]
MLSNTGVYAVKKRKKPVQKTKKTPAPDVVKSNPSKRHRDRLNGELDRLTGLLPFPEDVRSRLDKLSVLRISVGYLKVKSFFKATMKKSSVLFPGGDGLNMNGMNTPTFSEGDLLLQALNGFVLVVTAEGHVFYASPTIQDYLGFHQSDVVHQSVFELIHTDDRATFRRQLHFALNPKPFDPEQGGDGMASSSDITRNIVTYNPEQLPPENSSFLERNFVCRFRCLLDNSSGFLALNFQGRLKFLHGQSMLGDDGTRSQPRLGLFTIATPVHAPSILEIRSKTIFFQTKHKLDFTPTGVDARGKVVLGYSEIELCMRGSGYQFIHAADMMYCADNHVRMIKTGESGLTTFRLLQKTGCWVWVQSNARLVYKGGRPDFIIARQRALLNSEGEENLRQRKMQLPFSFTTGEALLYETGPTLDATEFQTNPPKICNVESLDPQSLLGSLLKQDESIYTQPQEPQLPIDQVFMDSRALTNVACNSWQSSMEPQGPDVDDDGDSPREVKQEGALVAMIDALERMAQDGDLCAALQGMDVGTAELMEWESTLLRLSQDSNGTGSGDTSLDLDDIMTNDIFSYVEEALFKESSEGSGNQPNCSTMINHNPNLFTAVLDNNNQGEPFTGVVSPTGAGQCKPGLLDKFSFVQNGSAVNNLNGISHSQVTGNRAVGLAGQIQAGQIQAGQIQAGQIQAGQNQAGQNQAGQNQAGQIQAGQIQAGQNQAGPQQVFKSTQRLSHFGPQIPQTGLNIPILQQLQLNDIFTPSLELPELSNPHSSGQNESVTFSTSMSGSCAQAPNNHIGSPQIIAGQVQSNQPPAQRFPHNGLPAAMAPNGPEEISVPQSNHLPPILVDAWASLIPSNGFVSPQIACSAPFQSLKTQKAPQWPQNQQHQLPPPASTMKNGHQFIPDCHSQATETQRVPLTGLWPQNTNGLYHQPQQGRLANGQPAPTGSCMFENVSPPLPNRNSHIDGTRLPPPSSVCQRRMVDPQDQSYFQWGPSEPVVGTSAIIQDNTGISFPSRPLVANITTPESLLAMQQYLAGRNRVGQTQIPSLCVVDSNGTFSSPPLVNGTFSSPPLVNGTFSSAPLVNGTMCFTDHNQTNYCDF